MHDDTDGACSEGPTHLVVLVHGIMGTTRDWAYVEEVLAAKCAEKRCEDRVLVHASAVNQRFSSLFGIDRAGARLAQEVLDLKSKYASLRTISVVGHSLGGLIARAALVHMLDPSDGASTLFGLQPVHLVTLTSPHLGLREPGLCPLLTWLHLPPWLPRLVARLLPLQTLRQLFLEDTHQAEAAAGGRGGGGGSPGGEASREPSTSSKGSQHSTQSSAAQPLLLQMAGGIQAGTSPGGNRYTQAVAAFESRTLYANIDCDHWVDWRGGAMATSCCQPPRTQPASSSPPPPSSPSCIVHEEGPPGPASARPKEVGEASGAEPPLSSPRALADHMATNLEGLGWRRVHVSFASCWIPLAAHYYMQVTRPYMAKIDTHGGEVAQHMADLVVASLVKS